MVKGRFFYCRYEIENFQWHLESSRAERENDRLNMASKPDLATREAGAEQETEREGKNERGRQREHRQKREQKEREHSWNSSVLRRIV